MGEQLVEVYKLLDVMVPEQVIAVPKIFVDDIPPRRLVRDPQLAEQLVAVPTPVSCPRSCAADGAPAGGSAAGRASACPVLRG